MTEGNTLLTRRQAVAGVAVAACLVGAGGVVTAGGSAWAESSAEVPKKQYGFLANSRRCVECKCCVEACRAHNGEINGTARRKIVSFESDFGVKLHMSVACMHCAEPSCMAVCPAGAITKRNDGIVTVDPDRCIGCKYCYQACPFSVPRYGSEGMDKCDCCIGAGIEPGQDPYCVQACAFDALVYGDLAELKANPAYSDAKPVEASTKPSYLVK